MLILFSRVKLIAMYFPVVIIDCIVTCGQHKGPMLIYAGCVGHVFNILALIMLEAPIQ